MYLDTFRFVHGDISRYFEAYINAQKQNYFMTKTQTVKILHSFDGEQKRKKTGETRIDPWKLSLNASNRNKNIFQDRVN